MSDQMNLNEPQATSQPVESAQLTSAPLNGQVGTNGNSQTAAIVPATDGNQKPQPTQGIAVGNGGIEFRTLGDMFRWGDAVIQSGMAPKGYTTPQQVIIATQMGFELGLKPMMALQSIAVIGNIPSVWGDGAWALVLSSPAYESHREWYEGEGDNLVSYTAVKRKGHAEHVEGFSMKDARDAGLLGKDIWKKYPKRMLRWRSRTYAMRNIFADVLKGFQIAEEVMDFPPEAFASTAVQAERPKFEHVQEADIVNQ